MRLCDESEDGNSADEQTESAASSCCRNTEWLNVPRFSRHHLSADDDKQISMPEFPTAVYLLMKRDKSSELIDFNSNLDPSVTKLVCVRTSSKDFELPF